jgi:hypothetical protein
MGGLLVFGGMGIERWLLVLSGTDLQKSPRELQGAGTPGKIEGDRPSRPMPGDADGIYPASPASDDADIKMASGEKLSCIGVTFAGQSAFQFGQDIATSEGGAKMNRFNPAVMGGIQVMDIRSIQFGAFGVENSTAPYRFAELIDRTDHKQNVYVWATYEIDCKEPGLPSGSRHIPVSQITSVTFHTTL